MNRLIAILIFLTVSWFSFAQTSGKIPTSALRKLEKAKETLSNLDWSAAMQLSEKLVTQYPNWAEAWMINAQASHEAGDEARSQIALQRLVRLDSTSYPEAFRWLAEGKFQKGDYRAASADMRSYLSLVRDTSAIPSKVKILSRSIDFALEQTKGASAVMPAKVGGKVNSAEDDYFPSLSVDGSVLVITRQVNKTGEPAQASGHEELLYSVFRDSTYTPPEAFPYPINSAGNQGTQSLSQDGRIMFFTACNRPDTKGGCDLYYCMKSGDAWSNPKNIGNPVNTRYWESTPFLAQDGKSLFFASNRPGGLGGMDLWISEQDTKRGWSAPRNLGPSVNTSGDEMSPFLLVDGKTLFFASNGGVGMGGFDLYKCDLSSLSVPENLGYGINTFNDEDAITINAGSNQGLFTSNRDTRTGKDIYQVDLHSFMPAQYNYTISGTVRNGITGMPVGAVVEIRPYGDTLVSRVESDPATGLYLLGIPERPSYRIGASCQGFLPYSNFYQSDTLKRGGRISFTIDLNPIQAGATMVLKNVFFTLDSYEILPESGKDLEEVMSLIRQNPGIILEISGYTDDSGSDDHNLALSQSRAEAVRQYLVDRGVSPTQLIAKGYGKSRPVASNETEGGRSLNRRTEMKVLSLKQN